jgi:hypothetical protein
MPSIRRFITLIDEGQSADTGVAASDPAACPRLMTSRQKLQNDVMPTKPDPPVTRTLLIATSYFRLLAG